MKNLKYFIFLVNQDFSFKLFIITQRNLETYKKIWLFEGCIFLVQNVSRKLKKLINYYSKYINK